LGQIDFKDMDHIDFGEELSKITFISFTNNPKKRKY
jgi:hypothetical protein